MKTLPSLIIAALSMAPTLFAGAGPGPYANGAYYPGQLDGRYSANVYNNTQARFDAGEMDPASGNRIFTNSFTVTPGTTNTVFTTNVTVNITNVNGIVTTTRVTNIVSSTVTNLAVTNLTGFGASNVVSGVVGFAIRNGTPSASGGGSSAGGATGGTNGTAAGGGAGGATTPGSGAAGGGSGGTVETIGLDSSHNYFVIYVNGDVFAGQTAAGINLNSKRVAGSLWNGIGGLTYQVVTNISVGTDTATLTNQVLAVPTATAGGYFNAKIKDNKSPFLFKGAGAITVNSAAAVASPSGTYPFNIDGIKTSENTISAYSTTGRDAP